MDGTFTCGHTAEILPNLFGRGEARKRRLKIYFDRLCLTCNLITMEGRVRTYTTIKGKPLTDDQYQEKIEQHRKSIRSTYLMTDN